LKPLKLLNQKWGYPDFRLNQKEIIESILEGNDCVALLPTGGGKSICYQIPGLLQEGLTLVVSPLISLMHDQIKEINQLNEKAIALTSGYSKSDLDRELDNCQNGYYKFLFVSPERLKSKWLRERLSHIEVNLIAIDEAHCISQWGHDFRPSYLNIHEIRDYVQGVPILALTATANTQVLKDIQEHLKLKSSKVFTNSFLRKNIKLNVQEVEDKLNPTIEALRGKSSSAIIYVRSRKKTLEFAKIMQHNGISADHFNAGLSIDTRKAKQTSWIKGDTKVIVATTAFGMGINKADVRTIVHPDLPEDLESYYQEIGRSGRDGEASEAYLFYTQSDFERLHYKWIQLYPSLLEIKTIYQKLGSHLQVAIGQGEFHETNFNLLDFCRKYEFDSQKTLNAFSFLQRLGFIEYLTNQSKAAAIKLNLSRDYESVLENEPESLLLIKTLVRSYGGISDFPVRVELKITAKRLNRNIKLVIEQLNNLANRKLLWFSPPSEGESLIFLQNRIDPKYFNPSKSEYTQILKIRKNKFESLKRFVEEPHRCRNKILLDYFNETLDQDCGTCDNCQKNESINIKDLIHNFINKDSSFKGVLNKIPAYLKDEAIELIRLMLENGELKKEGDYISKS
jgi:ATP-dependent DNA helicase RecQ